MKCVFFILLFTMCSLVATSQSCDLDGTFYYNYNDIKNLLDDKGCAGCHTVGGAADSWLYSTYEKMLCTGSCGDPVITHGDASTSLLFDKINGGTSACGEPMPLEGSPLSKEDIYIIESWINHGATEVCVPFYDDVKTVLSSYGCNACHTASSSWSYLSYGHITGTSGDGNCDQLVQPYSATSSVLYNVISTGADDCISDNTGHEAIASDDIKIIRDWINGGAQEGIFALPVELIDFDVSVHSDNEVELTWSTATEIGTDRFVVQRSHTGLSFTVIDEVTSKGDISQGSTYSFRDKDDYLGIVYYRLQIIDIDGTFSYSNIVSVKLEPNDDILNVYPNLINKHDMLQVAWHSRVDRPQAKGSIVSAIGQEIKEVLLTDGENTILLPELETGLYYIMVQDFFDSYQLVRFVVVE